MKYSIDTLLSEGTSRFGGQEYIFEREGSGFAGKSYSRFAQDVRRLAAALLRLDLAGKIVLLYGENSYNYMAADIAIMGYVGVSATISKEWKAADLIRAAEHLSAAAVIYSSLKAEVIEQLRAAHPQLIFICFDELSAMINAESLRELQPNPTDVCCKIIFSSGTTGVPKAVMLSQDNMFANYDSLWKRTPFASQDRDYLFLPLSHTYGGICNFLYSLISGMSIYICSDTKLIAEELQLVKPTVFCAVPLIFEKLYAACISSEITPKAVFGGCVRYLFSGGAYLRPEIREFIKLGGVNLLEAYGLSETSSLISCEYSNSDDFTSVGDVMENIEIRIDSPDELGRGEIVVRGKNIFMGYYGNPSATKASLDGSGWFRTGDIGYLSMNRLYLVGRKRRIILLSNGENIYPDEIEALFAEYAAVGKVKVYQRDGMVCASIYAAALCDGEGIVSEVNARLPKFSRISEFEVIQDSIESRMK